jgi:hypothetical protein
MGTVAILTPLIQAMVEIISGAQVQEARHHPFMVLMSPAPLGHLAIIMKE